MFRIRRCYTPIRMIQTELAFILKHGSFGSHLRLTSILSILPCLVIDSEVDDLYLSYISVPLGVGSLIFWMNMMYLLLFRTLSLSFSPLSPSLSLSLSLYIYIYIYICVCVSVCVCVYVDVYVMLDNFNRLRIWPRFSSRSPMTSEYDLSTLGLFN